MNNFLKFFNYSYIIILHVMLLLYMEKLAINVWLFVFFLHIRKDQKQYMYIIIYEQCVKECWKDFLTHKM
jgi:hypothetical protein